MSKERPAVLCLQETHFTDRKIHNLKSYNVFYKNRTNASRAWGGVAVYVKEDVHCVPIPLTTDLEVVAVSIKLLNTGSNTRFNAVDGTFSAIDLTFSSPTIATDCIWETDTYLHGSDCDQKLASDSSGLSGGFRGIGRGFGL
jgi:exonuclease III